MTLSLRRFSLVQLSLWLPKDQQTHVDLSNRWLQLHGWFGWNLFLVADLYLLVVLHDFLFRSVHRRSPPVYVPSPSSENLQTWRAQSELVGRSANSYCRPIPSLRSDPPPPFLLFTRLSLFNNAHTYALTPKRSAIRTREISLVWTRWIEPNAVKSLPWPEDPKQPSFARAVD